VDGAPVIAVDLGGTKILAGVVARDGSVGETVEVHTPTASEQAVLDALVSTIDQLDHAGAVAIGVGVPANIDRRTGTVLRATNLPFDHVDLHSQLAARFDRPVGVQNDANVAATSRHERLLLAPHCRATQRTDQQRRGRGERRAD
jgi:glucokinase